jgi:hypothetical protein
MGRAAPPACLQDHHGEREEDQVRGRKPELQRQPDHADHRARRAPDQAGDEHQVVLGNVDDVHASNAPDALVDGWRDCTHTECEVAPVSIHSTSWRQKLNEH